MDKSYSPQQLLTVNRKTGSSIDLPIKGHCKPTRICLATCYAKRGTQTFPAPKRKQLYISKYLRGKDLSQMIYELKGKSAVRLSGSGDLLSKHVLNVIHMAEAAPDTVLWGMTRKPEIAQEINDAGLPNLSILLTVDASSPDSTLWNYPGAMCFGPRLEGDNVPRDKRIITVFPYHSGGKIVGNIPIHYKDCPAVRKKKKGCLECHKCWNWK
jgi:hypothetical protein